MFSGLPGEIFIVDILRDRDSGKVNLGRGGEQIPLVDPGKYKINEKVKYP